MVRPTCSGWWSDEEKNMGFDETSVVVVGRPNEENTGLGESEEILAGGNSGFEEMSDFLKRSIFKSKPTATSRFIYS